MATLETQRLRLEPFSLTDFEVFVSEMLSDPRVVQFYYSYKGLTDLEVIRCKAKSDFWDEFELSRENYGWPTWAAYDQSSRDTMIGWCGLLHGELSETRKKPELQYMIAGDSHGQGYATELAGAVLQRAATDRIAESVIATVDIPNVGSIKVLEKLGFVRTGKVHAYGSDDMYLYELSLLD